MNLKEKFEEHDFLKGRVDRNIEIADEFAIGFAEWNYKEGRFIQKNLTTKELLEIYKEL